MITVEAPGFPGYRVSDDGRVWSDKTARWLQPELNSKGYLRVGLWSGGRATKIMVHVLVASAFHGPRPDGQVTRHLNGDHLDNRPGNLAYGTQSENNLDAVGHGRNRNALKTHCPKGHPYSESNTYLYRGKRNCRTCVRERQRK